MPACLIVVASITQNLSSILADHFLSLRTYTHELGGLLRAQHYGLWNQTTPMGPGAARPMGIGGSLGDFSTGSPFDA